MTRTKKSRKNQTNLEIEIPYRALLPRGLEGIIVAGKAFSATHDALVTVEEGSIMGGAGSAVAVVEAAHVGVRPREAEQPDAGHGREPLDGRRVRGRHEEHRVEPVLLTRLAQRGIPQHQAQPAQDLEVRRASKKTGDA